MRRYLVGLGLAALAGALWVAMPAQTAHACGGFFCGQQPVDQQAERIVFSVNDDGTVTMVVQIMYQGDADDFAWVLPLGAVPDAESLDTFPQAALSALDANTAPQFQYPDDPDCWGGLEFDAAAGGGGPPRASGEGGVDVHIRAEVGPFDVAVIESEDPSALVSWLRENGFRVTSPQEPYIAAYTSEGMKLLALRLQPDAEVSDIEPFMFTTPGQSPNIPLRLTALAAEPEMGIAVFILGDMRYGPAGDWTDVEIDNGDIVWRPYEWPLQTNWTALVARGVDEVGGKGLVTEFAGSTAPFLDTLRATTPADADQEEAINALLDLMDGHPYMTRMYTRLSPEEMTSDPSFRRTEGGDVDRLRTLPRYVDGRDLCDFDWSGPTPDDTTTPCDFASCGSAGLCRTVSTVSADGSVRDVAGCACVPGTTARTTFDPRGNPIVSCVDQRLSFLNPGDRELPTEAPLPDPCVGFDCGTGGACVAQNMTPTCVCDQGFVAVGGLTDDGSRTTDCVRPNVEVPDSFYDRTLPPRPAVLPSGRSVLVMPGRLEVAGGGGCSAGNADAATALPLGALALFGLVAFRRRRR